jgi:hypothetical protein
MKKYHPSQLSTPKRSKARRTRVHFQPPREETPFSKQPRVHFAWRHLRLLDAAYLVVTVIAGSALLGVIFHSAAIYHEMHSQLAHHTGQLAQLKTREASLHQRLAELQSPDGRDQLLRERGFVQGNERILLFADDAPPATEKSAAAPVSESTATPTAGTEHTSFLGGVVHAIDSAADRPAAH